MIVCVRGVKNLPMIISNYPSFWRVSLQGNENIKRIRFSEKKIPQSERLGGKWGYSSTHRGCNPSYLFLAIAKDPMSLHLGPSVRGRACFVLTDFVKFSWKNFPGHGQGGGVTRTFSGGWGSFTGTVEFCESGEGFWSDKCRNGFPVTCVVGFCSVVLPTKKMVFSQRRDFRLLETFLFLTVVSFGKEVRINGQDEQVLSYL